MYERKNRDNQKQLKIMSLEDLVPQDHILRVIDQSIDFSFIYDLVKGYPFVYNLTARLRKFGCLFYAFIF